jgi:predicted AlkP superfamily phosphohydrolase/phosphomutase
MPVNDSDFTFPSAFREKLLSKISDYCVLVDWDKNGLSGTKFDENCKRIERCFDIRVETAKIVTDEIDPEIMMVQFQNIDYLCHMIWPYLDSKSRDKFPEQRDRLWGLFRKLDDSIGEILKIKTEDTIVTVVSDHGFCSWQGRIKPNLLLYKWGYLKYKNPLQRMIRRLGRNFDSALSKKKSITTVEEKTSVDWKRSCAMVVYPSMNGHVYLNIKDRNLNGTVEPSQTEALIEELKEKFLTVKDPLTGDCVFKQVVKSSELYGDAGVDNEIVGDLILVPNDGFIAHQSTTRKGRPVENEEPDSLVGCHHPNGIYILSGAGITKGSGDANIADIAPTLYALLGIEIPGYVNGKVLTNCFSSEISVKYQKQDGQIAKKSRAEKSMSDTEEDKVHKRLEALGYME